MELISITHNIKTPFNLLVFNTGLLQPANASCRQLQHLQEQPHGGKKHMEKSVFAHDHYSLGSREISGLLLSLGQSSQGSPNSAF